MMTGIWCGAIRSRLIGFLKNIVCSHICGLITFGVGMNSAAKTCLIKISKNLRGVSTRRIIEKSPMSMISCLLLFYYLASMSFCINNSNELKVMAELCGSWNPLLNAKVGGSSSSAGLLIFPVGSPITKTIHRNPMSAKSTSWTPCFWVVGNSTCESMPFVLLITHWQFICIGLGLLVSHTIVTITTILTTYVQRKFYSR